MQSTGFSVKLSSVSERKNNEINKMNNENMITCHPIPSGQSWQTDRIDQHLGGLLTELRELKAQDTVLVSCCGCNHEQHITREAADEWTDTDWFMCQECE